MRRPFLVSLAVTLLSVTPASAQSGPVYTQGKCVRYVLNDTDFSSVCSWISYMHVRRFTLIMIPVAGEIRNLTISGHRTDDPPPGAALVSTVEQVSFTSERFTGDTLKTKALDAKGTCTAMIDKDQNYVRSLTCEATGKGVSLNFVFEGEGILRSAPRTVQ